MPQRTPTLFLIGAQKAGSTFLASHLEQASEIAFYGQKEPNIFSLGDESRCREKMASYTLPDDAPPILLDASPDYSRIPFITHVPEMIAKIVGSDTPKFIYILRDPVERTISHYFWSRQRYGESYDFEEAIEKDKRYIEGSLYDRQIEEYWKVFEQERFYFLKFEDYIADPLATLPDLLNWAGASMPDLFAPKEEFDASTNKVESRQPLFPLLNRIARREGILREAIKALVPARHHHRLARGLSRSVPRPHIDPATKQRLREVHFRRSIEMTAEMTGLDLSDWLENGATARVSDA
ncbi:MAG: sulfotransferase domain-containing protein [Pseudomonadota bacterium]